MNKPAPSGDADAEGIYVLAALIGLLSSVHQAFYLTAVGMLWVAGDFRRVSPEGLSLLALHASVVYGGLS